MASYARRSRRIMRYTDGNPLVNERIRERMARKALEFSEKTEEELAELVDTKMSATDRIALNYAIGKKLKADETPTQDSVPGSDQNNHENAGGEQAGENRV